MFRFNRVVCMLLVCSFVGIAYGAAVRITDFVISEDGSNADAMAILTYAPGRDITNVQVIVSDFEPGRTYGMRLVCPDFPDCCGTVVTSSSGNGNGHMGLVGDVSGCTVQIGFHLGNEELRDVRACGPAAQCGG